MVHSPGHKQATVCFLQLPLGKVHMLLCKCTHTLAQLLCAAASAASGEKEAQQKLQACVKDVLPSLCSTRHSQMEHQPAKKDRASALLVVRAWLLTRAVLQQGFGVWCMAQQHACCYLTVTLSLPEGWDCYIGGTLTCGRGPLCFWQYKSAGF
jgi:hypothetical protein